MLSRIGLRRGIFSYFFSQSRNREICNCFLGGGCFYYPKSRKSCGLVEITTFTEFSNVFNRSLTLNASFLPGTPIWVTRLDVFAAMGGDSRQHQRQGEMGLARLVVLAWPCWTGDQTPRCDAGCRVGPASTEAGRHWKVERNHLEKGWKNGTDPLWGQSQTRQRRSTHRIWQFSNSSKHFHSIFVQTNFSWFTTGTSHPPQHVRWRLASAGVRKVRSWVSIGSAGTAAVFAVWHGIPWKAASP